MGRNPDGSSTNLQKEKRNWCNTTRNRRPHIFMQTGVFYSPTYSYTSQHVAYLCLASSYSEQSGYLFGNNKLFPWSWIWVKQLSTLGPSDSLKMQESNQYVLEFS
ncbi:hypothetical protein AVEN_100911-1 [Araneus ventricosus]|uniref:Uncharacterized protein n=1 Tax=Araneus ventricosus TaxID=182803 RepID=A0A4Y2AWF0_ARAVE|nr:hypothetical protein AVEN_100911-1 [Araneus ventricosus]